MIDTTKQDATSHMSNRTKQMQKMHEWHDYEMQQKQTMFPSASNFGGTNLIYGVSLD